jgi:outer membrane protein assembly factor BamB
MRTKTIAVACVLGVLPAQEKEPPTAKPPAKPNTAQTRAGPLDVLWKVPLTSTSFGGAAVADADGDGKLEVAFCTYFYDSRVLVLNGEDGSELWTHRSKPKSERGECWDASLRFADVNADGKLELVVPVSSGCRVHAFDAKTGRDVWTYRTGPGDCIDSPPAILDVNKDGFPDVVFGSFHKRLHVVDGKTGKGIRTVTGFDGFVQTGPVVLDLNGDGEMDYIAGTMKGDNRVTAIDGKTGKEIWYYEIGKSMGIYHGPSVGDLDGDGKPEIVICAYDGRVSCLEASNGKVEWSVKPGDRYFMAPTAIADIDDDGKPEVIAVSQRLTVIEHDGKVKYSVSLARKNPYGGAHRGASIADLDGDGSLDIAYLMDDGYFAGRRGRDGKRLYDLEVKSYFEGTVRGNNNGPVLADLNGDGKLDAFFVVGSGSSRGKGAGVAVCVTGFDGTGDGWYMLRHDALNTGNVGTPITPALRKRIRPAKKQPKR